MVLIPLLIPFNIKYFKDYEKSWDSVSSDFALEHRL